MDKNLPKRITMQWIDRTDDQDLLESALDNLQCKMDTLIPKQDRYSDTMAYTSSDQYVSLEDRVMAIQEKIGL